MVCMIYYVDFASVGVNGRRIYNSEGYSVRCVMHGECDVRCMVTFAAAGTSKLLRQYVCNL